MQMSEIIVFIIYLIAMVAIGIYFFIRDRNGGEKTYFLGDRKMGAWVSALSAGASDMSAWVLMGLPGAIFAAGMGQVWIAAGLAIGYTICWLTEAPRLRKFSIVAGDSITIPQFLTNRFISKSKALQVACALVFLIAYTIYAASSIKACGKLFNTVTGMPELTAMYLAAIIIVSYTFLGGFSAVCWTDFFQGMLMLGAMFIAPIFACFNCDFSTAQSLPENYFNPMASWQDIVSGMGWGLGYFGMPHIIIRFMSIKSQRDLKKSAIIGITWTVLIVIFAALIGIIGRLYFGNDGLDGDKELVFITMVRRIFPGIVSGILLSAVLAASMSTADSQLLAASSAFASDVYKPLIRKDNISETDLLWTGRFIVLIILLLALVIATNPDAGSIMGLVSNAWGVFGAAFGPVLILSLFWKRFNFQGALVGIIVGAAVDIAWLVTPALSGTGVYEIIPGFIAGLIASAIAAMATPAPKQDVQDLFDKAAKYED